MADEGVGERLWVVRGMLCAISIIAVVVPQFLSLSRYEFLRAIHVVIVGWNEIASRVGRVIGEIPYIPDLSAEVINLIVFLFSFCVPLMITDYRYLPPDFTGIRRFIHASAGATIPLIAFTAIITDDFFGVSGLIVRLFFLVALAYHLWVICVGLPSFRKGLQFLVGALVVFELLYVVNAPWFTDGVNALACDVLEGEPGCPAPEDPT